MLHSSIVGAAIVQSQQNANFGSTATQRPSRKMAFYTDTKHRQDWIDYALAAGIRTLQNAATRHAKHRVYKQTLNELSQLSDRDLADLGFRRADLKSIARHAAEGTAEH